MAEGEKTKLKLDRFLVLWRYANIKPEGNWDNAPTPKAMNWSTFERQRAFCGILSSFALFLFCMRRLAVSWMETLNDWRFIGCHVQLQWAYFALMRALSLFRLYSDYSVLLLCHSEPIFDNRQNWQNGFISSIQCIDAGVKHILSITKFDRRNLVFRWCK